MAMSGSDWHDFSWSDSNNDINDIYIHPLSDEEILDRMDVEVIEKFLRKKKLEKINGKQNGSMGS